MVQVTFRTLLPASRRFGLVSTPFWILYAGELTRRYDVEVAFDFGVEILMDQDPRFPAQHEAVCLFDSFNSELTKVNKQYLVLKKDLDICTKRAVAGSNVVDAISDGDGIDPEAAQAILASHSAKSADATASNPPPRQKLVHVGAPDPLATFCSGLRLPSPSRPSLPSPPEALPPQGRRKQTHRKRHDRRIHLHSHHPHPPHSPALVSRTSISPSTTAVLARLGRDFRVGGMDGKELGVRVSAGCARGGTTRRAGGGYSVQRRRRETKSSALIGEIADSVMAPGVRACLRTEANSGTEPLLCMSGIASEEAGSLGFIIAQKFMKAARAARLELVKFDAFWFQCGSYSTIIHDLQRFRLDGISATQELALTYHRVGMGRPSDRIPIYAPYNFGISTQWWRENRHVPANKSMLKGWMKYPEPAESGLILEHGDDGEVIGIFYAS
ncbi:hypothetical protein C8R45DRAFT_922743 [Mycena sanguinolenta]|nr:hypothetical protein C8R45DRAFT_922743 [Mycena sanguinolenta]